MERQFRFFCCCASSLMEHIFAASFVFRFYWFLRGSFFFWRVFACEKNNARPRRSPINTSVSCVFYLFIFFYIETIERSVTETSNRPDAFFLFGGRQYGESRCGVEWRGR